MSVTRRALLGFFAGLPLALRSMASEAAEPCEFQSLFNDFTAAPCGLINENAPHTSVLASMLERAR